MRVLVTTPDYYPKLGGLTTFTDNLLKSLEGLNLTYDLFVWDNINEIKHHIIRKTYDLVLNVHFMGGYYLSNIPKNVKVINFCHGSEILLTSPSFIKRTIKSFYKDKYIQYLKDSYRNIAISNFTLNKLHSLPIDYNVSRDIVIHNCINLKKCTFENPNINDDEIKIICLARDVEHKNLLKTLRFVEEIAKSSNKEFVLFITKDVNSSVNNLNTLNISNIDEVEKEEMLRNSHLNILLSKDNSKKGFFEGFGLTVLEAGKYGVPSIVANTGGLSESVHDDETGWVINSYEKEVASNLWNNKIKKHYKRISLNCFEHTNKHHSIEMYQKLLKGLVF